MNNPIQPTIRMNQQPLFPTMPATVHSAVARQLRNEHLAYLCQRAGQWLAQMLHRGVYIRSRLVTAK